MPVVVGEVDDDRDEHGEGFVLVGFEDVKEVVVFKEAHCSVGNLQVDATNAADNAFEKFGDQVFHFVDFADFEDFLQFSEEEGLLDAVGEGPVLEQALEEGDGEGAVLGEEEH